MASRLLRFSLGMSRQKSVSHEPPKTDGSSEREWGGSAEKPLENAKNHSLVAIQPCEAPSEAPVKDRNPFSSSHDNSPKEYYSHTLRPLKTFHLRPGSVGSSLHYPLRGYFEAGFSFDSVFDFSEIEPWDTYRYCLVSDHFPTTHKGQSTTNRDTPWFAQLVMEFNNMDVFTQTDFDWMKNMKYRSIDKLSIQYDAHPYIDDVAMYSRSITLEFRAVKEGDENSFQPERDFQNSWEIRIDVYSRCDKDLDFKLKSLPEIISRETCVRLKGFRTNNTSDPLSDSKRFFIKYPISSARPQGFVESLDRELELDDQELWKVVDANFERQLYCLGEEEIYGWIEGTDRDGGEAEKCKKSNKKKGKAKKGGAKKKKTEGEVGAADSDSDNGTANQP